MSTSPITIAPPQEVWIASQLPLQFYHSLGSGSRTPKPCDIFIRGYGFRVTLEVAQQNANKPCPLCYGHGR
jgi:hypothetical protein